MVIDNVMYLSALQSGVITLWTPSLLLGGVTYSSGVLTIPSDGVYYVYMQIYFDPSSSGSNYVVDIRANGRQISRAYSAYTASETRRTKFSGTLWQLRKGDRVDVYGYGRRYFMGSDYSFFGLWKIN